MRILALCGSLRRESVHRLLLGALAQAAPPSAEFEFFDGLHALPHFNPDDEEAAQAVVIPFQRAIAEADVVIVACPEYAHGIPGAFKNALDHIVNTTVFDGKPTLLLCASARSGYAPAQLAEVLRTLGAALSGPVVVELPLNPAGAQAALHTPTKQSEIKGVLEQFLNRNQGAAAGG